MNTVQSWFKWLVEWLRDFSTHECNADIPALEHMRSPNGKILAESIRRDTPGAVSTWYVRHSDESQAQLIVTLDNVFAMERAIKARLPVDTNAITRTHLLSIHWLIWVGKREKCVCRFSYTWLADLEGRSTYATNAKATEVVRYTIAEVLALPPLPGISWENRMVRYCWEDAIRSKCALIAHDHNPYLKPVRKPDLIQVDTKKPPNTRGS